MTSYQRVRVHRDIISVYLNETVGHSGLVTARQSLHTVEQGTVIFTTRQRGQVETTTDKHPDMQQDLQKINFR